MIRKRYDELKSGDVFRLSDGRTYVLVAEVHGGGGAKVRVNGYRDADPAKGVHSFSTAYLAERKGEVYSLDEIESPLARLREWGAEHGRGVTRSAARPRSISHQSRMAPLAWVRRRSAKPLNMPITR